ncbi:MAG TPA: zf-TFIIB domain-containing protein [Polyangiales bacterium]|nr:zf-TFIIB domain-containing protein [Polyangiales bacterium]
MVGVVYRCPECRTPLAQKQVGPGSVWACGSCAGVCANLAVLRQHAPEPLVQQLWASARDRGSGAERPCPSCSNPLRTFELDAKGDRVQLDGCVRCLMLWFDGRELEQIGVQLPERSAQRQEVRTAQALMDSEGLYENAKFETAADIAKLLMMQIYYWRPWW